MAGDESSGMAYRVGVFPHYLPQDEAVSSGMVLRKGEEIGINTSETQEVVDLVNSQLSILLRMPSKEFWKNVVRDYSLHEFLDYYLRYHRRWFDVSDIDYGHSSLSTGVVVGDEKLSRRVFMLLFRMSSNVEEGTPLSQCLNEKEHSMIIYEQNLFNFSKLLDICAIYGKENFEITKLLVSNVLSKQSKFFHDIKNFIPSISQTLDTMKKRMFDIFSSFTIGNSNEKALHKIKQGLEDACYFIYDLSMTLNLFLQICPHSALFFLKGIDNKESFGFMSALSSTHNILLPLIEAFSQICSTSSKINDHVSSNSQPSISSIQIMSQQKFFFIDSIQHLKSLQESIVELTWQFLSNSFLNPLPFETNETWKEKFILNAVEKGEAIFEIILEICSGSDKDLGALSTAKNDIRNIFVDGKLGFELENRFNLLNKLKDGLDQGAIVLDPSQLEYIQDLILPSSNQPSFSSTMSHSSLSNSGKILKEEGKIVKEEEENRNFAIHQSKIEKIKDLFPDLNDSFLSTCLNWYNEDEELVIQSILENQLPPELMNSEKPTATTEAPRPLPTSLTEVQEKGKGKGKMVVDSWDDAQRNSSTSVSKKSWISNREDLGMNETSSIRSSSSRPTGRSSPGKYAESWGTGSATFNQGRYVRKNKDGGLEDNDRSNLEKIKKFVKVFEYDDEYDDSFDDLGAYEDISGDAELGTRPNQLNLGGTNLDEKVLEESNSKSDFQDGDSFEEPQSYRPYESGSKAGSSSTQTPSSRFANGKMHANGIPSKSLNSKDDISVKKGKGISEPRGSEKWSKHANKSNSPQFYVKDGKNYSYKVEGAISANSAEEAEKIRKEQAELIYGLGKGGNKALHFKEVEPNDEERGGDDGEQEDGVNHGRFNVPGQGGGGREIVGGGGVGGGRGRGRGSGATGNHPNTKREYARKEQNKASSSNHNRKDRALKKHNQNPFG